MIASHEKTYSSEHVHFMCRDIVDDATLPEGDMCLIRQVLQHLSNDEIKKVLPKLKQYQYSLITEHVTPKKQAQSFNADILTGHHNRIGMFSGVYLDEAPFNLECEIILRIPYDAQGISELVTYLVRS